MFEPKEEKPEKNLKVKIIILHTVDIYTAKKAIIEFN